MVTIRISNHYLRALFSSESSCECLIKQFKAAQEEYFELIPTERTGDTHNLSTAYLRYFMEYIYDNFDAFKLIICCSDGTKYKNFIYVLVEIEVSKTEKYHQELLKRGKFKGRVRTSSYDYKCLFYSSI